jgi:hypothetical protein
MQKKFCTCELFLALLTWQSSKYLIKHQTHQSDYSAQQYQAKNRQSTCGGNTAINLLVVAT